MKPEPPLVLSTSAITAYLRCHYAYLLGYVFRLKGEQSVAAAIGQAVHAGVEAMHRQKAVSPVDALQQAWMLETGAVPTIALDADPDGLSDALRMLDVYREEVLPTFHPTYIEAPFQFQVAGAIITGVLDGADEDVRDLKTTAGKTINGRKPRFDPERYDLQLGIYKMGYNILTGRWPKRLLLDVLTRRGTYRQYDRTDKVNTGDAIDAIKVVRDGINREEFEPTGAYSGACHWCSYVSRCSYAVID